MKPATLLIVVVIPAVMIGSAIGLSTEPRGSKLIRFAFRGEVEGNSVRPRGCRDRRINGDYVPDVAVGAPGSRNLAGRVHVYSGADGTVLHRFAGAAAGIVFGRTIAGLGDIDGDGRTDFAIGAPQADLLMGSRDLPDAGRVYVYSGANAQILHQYDGTNVTRESPLPAWAMWIETEFRILYSVLQEGAGLWRCASVGQERRAGRPLRVVHFGWGRGW